MRYLEMPWGRMAYHETGRESLPLLLLHGTGCDSHDWKEVLCLLPSGRHVIALDFRSHGGSDAVSEPFKLSDLADDALFLLAHLGIKKAVVMGHSLGGMVAMDAAARSGLIGGLVLVEGWTSLDAAATFGKGHHYGRLPPEKIGAIEKKAEIARTKTSKIAWAEFWNSVVGFSAKRFLHETGIPICEIYGNIGKPARLDRLQLPGHLRRSIIWVKKAGHYLPHERPVDVAAICADFMRTHSFWPCPR